MFLQKPCNWAASTFDVFFDDVTSYCQDRKGRVSPWNDDNTCFKLKNLWFFFLHSWESKYTMFISSIWDGMCWAAQLAGHFPVCHILRDKAAWGQRQEMAYSWNEATFSQGSYWFFLTIKYTHPETAQDFSFLEAPRSKEGVMERLIVPQPQAVDSLRSFQVLLLDRRSRLHGQIRSLRDIIRKIEKLRKRSLLAYITGSSLSAAGAITAIVGLSLSPITLGTSLLASAVGLGVATAGGAVTLSSDLSLMFRNSRELRKVQDIAAICQDQMREILGCLDFFCRGQGCLDFQLLQSGKKASIALYNSVYFIVFFGSRGFLIPRHAEGATKVSQAVLKAKIQKLAESLESCTTALDELSQQLESRVQLYAKTKHENPALDSKDSLDKYGGMIF